MHVEGTGETYRYSKKRDWLDRIPKEFKLRWWTETDYGKREPSPELVQELHSLLEVNKSE